MEKKSRAALDAVPFLASYTGKLGYGHETVLYYYGTGHGECNVHLLRYLEKNKEAEGKEDSTIKNSTKWHYEKVKVVKFILKPGREKMLERMCLSEHPFGTIKRAMGATYFLLKGLRKVTGEFTLFCLGYNIERAKNLLGFDKMMEIMAGA